MSRFLFPSLVLTLALYSGLPAPKAAFAQQDELTVTETEKKLFDLINQEREKANASKAEDDPTRLAPFLPNSKLFTAARGHAKNMSVKGAAHKLDEKFPWDRAWDVGYPKGNYIQENIASGSITPEITVANWMKSTQGHREAILNPKTRILGVGVAQSENGTFLWCANFGSHPVENANPPKLVVAATKPAPAGTTPTQPNVPTRPQTGTPATTNPGTKLPQGLVVLLPQEKAVFDLINTERAKAGVPALKINAKLYNASAQHATAMVKAGGLNHVLDGKTPTDRAKALGYPSEVDEVFNGGAVTAARCVSDWMGSEKLRAKLLNPNTTEIGVAFTQSPDTTNVWNIKLGSSPEAANPPRIELFKPQE